jgi:hypothetical protein
MRTFEFRLSGSRLRLGVYSQARLVEVVGSYSNGRLLLDSDRFLHHLSVGVQPRFRNRLEESLFRLLLLPLL